MGIKISHNQKHCHNNIPFSTRVYLFVLVVPNSIGTWRGHMKTGTLFTEDFLAEGIRASPVWGVLAGAETQALLARLLAMFSAIAGGMLSICASAPHLREASRCQGQYALR